MNKKTNNNSSCHIDKYFFNNLIISDTRDLINLAQTLEIDTNGLKRGEIIRQILIYTCAKEEVQAKGIVELVQDNYGFIRFQKLNYVTCSEDIYISNTFIREHRLKTGDEIIVNIKLPTDNDKNYAIAKILMINDTSADTFQRGISFEKRKALYPNRFMHLELLDYKNPANITLRTLDCIAPIGFGQRAMIVAPPKTGKTTIMKNIAQSITINHPHAYLIMLLIGERPEEVTEMERFVKGEVISSTFDEPPQQQTHLSEIVLERAKRLVETGKDVVILMDSLTRLARAYNAVMPSSGKILTGGVDVNALQRPKLFFGSARNLIEGGSLTIIATTLIETESRMDSVVFEELKGTGNWEIVLERKIAERQIFPAIDIQRSSTREARLFMKEDVLLYMNMLRRFLANSNNVEAIEYLLSHLRQTKDNSTFYSSLNT